MSEAAAKQLCTSFFYWWYNQPGANTEEGFDEWAKGPGKELIAAFVAPQTGMFDLLAHLMRQRAFSLNTFGPGNRTQGVIDHIRKELVEIESDPLDLKEWIDIVLLALDGAWRTGATPAEIVAELDAKQTKNEGRVWPDWRTVDPNKAIEHDRSADRVLH